jgi:hypothetical protein
MSKPKKNQGSRDAARQEQKVAFDEVVALIKERRKYADWIAALEAKRAQTPEAVYAKVHLDYETRLKSVVDKLSEHRGELTAEQAVLKKKLDEIEEELAEAQEERSETEIRAQVGELSAAALTEALRVADTEIERLEDKRSALEADLAKIAEFFSAADGTAPVHAPAPKPRSAGFDELSFLNSVVGPQKSEPRNSKPTEARVEPVAETPPPKPHEVPEKPAEVPAPQRPSGPVPAPAPTPAPAPVPVPPAPPAPAAAAAAAPAPAPAKPPEGAQADGVVEKQTELEAEPPKPVMRQSIAMQMASLTMEPGTGAKAQSDMGIIKTGDELPPSILADLTPGSGAQKPLAANVASNNPLSLKGSTPSDLKTLKCRECGSMNDPSEWYCERCGAELSAI